MEKAKDLAEMFEAKKELIGIIIRSFYVAESEQSEDIESSINSVMTDWFSTEGFLEHPIYWQTMLEVFLTQCSMIVGGKDYREYYKALTDIYIKTLEGTFGKVAIQQDIDWFNKH